VNGRAAASGFSLLELMIALAVVTIVVMAALPSREGEIDKVAVAETIGLVAPYKLQVAEHYQNFGEFPANNEVAGLPPANLLQGNYLQSVTIENGAVHMELGNKIRPELQGKIVSLRPIFVPGVPGAPISWVCGRDTVPGDMIAAGPDRTTLEAFRLPVQCR